MRVKAILLFVSAKNNEIIPPAVATLVCLASDFHPDHLKLFWKVNGAKRTEGVQTDEFSTQNESTYSLTSELRISAQECINYISIRKTPNPVSSNAPKLSFFRPIPNQSSQCEYKKSNTITS
uniref:Immunoglobulin C1-set domain-containing protein n=1 Tax=Bubo bubo TaxID=30461 RepID=A0A8C0EK25_BUBBB